MIEVKGTRATRPSIDPADPLGLRKPVDAGAGAVSGLLGLAVYLRSFLWAEPVPAQAAGGTEAPRPPGEEEAGPVRSAPQGQLKLAASERGAREAPDAAEGAAAPAQPLPFIFGPFDPGAFARVPPPLRPGLEEGFAANAPLPPFGPPRRPPPRDAAEAPDAGQPDLGAVFPPGEPDDAAPDPDGPPEDGTGPVGDPRNRAPRNSGPVQLREVGSGATLALALTHLLANTRDEDGDRLSVVMGQSTSGTVQPQGAGWRYLADAEHLGAVEIRYEVTDGRHTVQQTAVLTVVENLREGSAQADLILGTEGRDRVFGHGGDDNIATFAGRDLVHAGAGNDNVAGGAGRDTLFGDAGDDLIAGGADADVIFGGDGDDRLFGEAGDDELHGDAGNDLLDGGEGADTLTGDAGNDTLLGGEGDDLLAGGEGDDQAHGGSGNDVIFGDDGADLLLGDGGADILFGGNGADTLDGGTDNDVLSGGDGNDLLLAGNGDDLAAGGEGDDRIFGGAGSDHLAGDAGNDLLDGGEGSDTVTGGEGDDVVVFGSDHAADVFDGGEGFDALVAAIDSSGVQFDLIQGSVTGADGTADAFSGFEAFVGSAESDVFLVAGGAAILTGNGGGDLFAFVPGDRLAGPQSAYRITDFTAADTMTFSNELAGLSMRKAQRSVEDRVEDFFDDFAERFSADEPHLRYFHEWTEDYQRTIVEVDFDHDSSIDLVVTLEGSHEFDVARLVT